MSHSRVWNSSEGKRLKPYMLLSTLLSTMSSWVIPSIFKSHHRVLSFMAVHCARPTPASLWLTCIRTADKQMPKLQKRSLNLSLTLAVQAESLPLSAVTWWIHCSIACATEMLKQGQATAFQLQPLGGQRCCAGATVEMRMLWPRE